MNVVEQARPMTPVTSESNPALRILFVGAGNQGSDARGMGRAFSRLGHVVHEVDPRQFLPITWQAHWLRAVRRLLDTSLTREFNEQLLRDMESMEPSLMVVYKGESVLPDTLEAARAKGICCVNVYPDVSMFTHGRLIPQCMQLYNHIFTTKSFGARDLYEHFKLTNVTFLPHGFDPEVHRKFDRSALKSESLQCDASFIGTWSPKKETYLHEVATQVKGVALKIWGAQWELTKSPEVRACFTGKYIMGILYPVAVQHTLINIAILSEARTGSSSGDLTTARTFNIPSAGGFMLHERTDELSQFFEEGKEIACFGSASELADKVHYYLHHPEERERIRLAGYRRSTKENSIDVRAQRILDWYYDQRRIAR
jgi:spore maturation protein CgeB